MLRSTSANSKLDSANRNLENSNTKLVGSLEREQQLRNQIEAIKEKTLYMRRIPLAHSAWRDGDITRAKQLLWQCPASMRHWEWFHTYRLCFADLMTFRGRRRPVLSADGTRVVGGGFSQSPKKEHAIFDVQSGRRLLKLENTGDLRGGEVGFSPDGTRIVGSFSDSDQSVRVWDARTGKELITFKAHSGSDAASVTAISPDAQHIVSRVGWFDREKVGRFQQTWTVKLWHATTGEELLKLEGAVPPWVAFSPDSSRIAYSEIVTEAGIARAALRVWDLERREVVLTVKHKLARSDGSSMDFRQIFFSPTGDYIATNREVMDAGGVHNQVVVFDDRNGQALFSFRASMVLGFSPDGRSVVGQTPNAVKIWDVENGRELRTLEESGDVTHISFSPDGTRIAAGSGRSVKVWSARWGNKELDLKGHSEEVGHVVFTADGSRLVSNDGNDIKVWSASANSTTS